MRSARGYILVETVTAMAVLSITAAAVQQAVYTAVQARGLARDYTTAQWLMEDLFATAELQPRLAAGVVQEGRFPAPDDRFAYRWSVTAEALALPPLPAGLPPEQRAAVEASFLRFMGRMTVEIAWTRGGQPFDVSGTTLISPDRLWVESDAGGP